MDPIPTEVDPAEAGSLADLMESLSLQQPSDSDQPANSESQLPVNITDTESYSNVFSFRFPANDQQSGQASTPTNPFQNTQQQQQPASIPLFPSPVRQITPEYLRRAHAYVSAVKSYYIAHNLPKLPQYDIPEEQKPEFLYTLNVLLRLVMIIDPMLAMYFVVLNDKLGIKKLIAIDLSSRYQRFLMMSSRNKFIFNLGVLRSMIVHIKGANELFMRGLRTIQSNPSG